MLLDLKSAIQSGSEGPDRPLTLIVPLPCPISPSEVHRTSYREIQSPIFGMTWSSSQLYDSLQHGYLRHAKHTLFAYFAFMLSWMASMLSFLRSSGWISTRSATFVCTMLEWAGQALSEP